jgi:hypothetical protein
MKRIKKFSIFEEDESDKRSYSFEELSDSAKKNAISKVRDEMWEGNYGSSDIPEWVVDDDYLFEPTHDEMVNIFGPGYNESLGENPMIGNTRKGISYVSKDDGNYYLHCKEALDVNNEEMFLGFLGIPPRFWDELNYRFYDRRTYTEIEFEIENVDDLSQKAIDSLSKYMEEAEKNFEQHMSSVLSRITDSINDQYKDEEIIDRIDNERIEFNSEGDILD